MKKIKYILGTFIVFLCHEMFPMSSTKAKLGLNIKNLKGTHEVLKDYPGYEPFWGLVFVEKDVAKNLYTFSTLQIKKQAAEIIRNANADLDFLKESVEDFFRDKQDTATQNLIRHMFHEAGGTFNVTNAINNPVKQFTPEHLGKILRIVHDSGTDYAKMEADLKACLLSLGLLDSKGKPFPCKDFNPFIKTLIGGVQECSAQNPDMLFAPGTAQGIILGYLLLIANDRVDLEKYFTGFLGINVSLSQEQYSAENFKDILRTVSDLRDSKQFAEFVCAMIYQQKYASLFPKLSTSKTVKYAGVSFTDCMENTMLNLINIATYNQENGILGYAPEGLTMNTELINFYNQYPDPAEIDHKDVNQAWTNIVESVQGVICNRIVHQASQAFLEVKSYCDGAISVDEVDASLPVKIVRSNKIDFKVCEKRVGNQTYWLVSKKSGFVCCELMPTVSNVIVLMNKLFDLHLYSSVNDAYRPDFVSIHFESMCQKFDWKAKTKDFKEVVIQAIGGQSFVVHLIHKSHAYISISQNRGEKPLGDVLLDNQADKQAVCIALGFDNVKADFLSTLFYNQLLNPFDRLKIIQTGVSLQGKKKSQFLDNFIISFNVQHDEYYQYCLLRVYKNHPYKSIEVWFDLHSLKLNEISVQHLEFYKTYFSDNAHKQQLLLLINKLIGSSANICDAVSLAISGIDKGVLHKAEVEQVIAWIQEGLKSKNGLALQCALSLACSAVAKGIVNKTHLEQVIAWIEIGLSEDAYSKNGSLRLAGIVLEHGLFDTSHIERIFSWVHKSMEGKEEFIQSVYVGLMHRIIASDLLDKSYSKEVASWIQAGFSKKIFIDLTGLYIDLACKAISKNILSASNLKQIISWIEISMKKSPYALSLALTALRKDLLNPFYVKQILLMTKDSLLDRSEKFNDLLMIFEKEAENKNLINKKIDCSVFDEQESDMMDLAIKKYILEQLHMNRIRTGLPANVQEVKEQFIPPSADGLEQQQEAIEEFSQELLQQDLPEMSHFFDLHLPQQVSGQIAAQPTSMFTRWRESAKGALLRGVRSVRR